MIVPKYFEDFDHLHVNTMPNRAYYIPASRRMEDRLSAVQVFALPFLVHMLHLLYIEIFFSYMLLYHLA